MAKTNRWILFLVAAIGLLLLVLIAWRLLATQSQPVEQEPYLETFEAAGSWTAGEGAYASGDVSGGAYVLTIEEGGDIFWATAGRNFSDAEFEVEATPLEGPMDNGYGLLFRVDQEKSRFYEFKVSSDGYVLIGLCSDNCLTEQALVDRDWFASAAVEQGLGVTNRLKVIADGPILTFYVNEEQVGQVDDTTLTKGDIGLLAETFTPSGLRVAYDNFRVTPLNTD
jgi:hypothetical protein